MWGKKVGCMKLAIMQPYFFPYIGYYSVLKHVDRYIYLNNVQYIYHGWMNRNRILHPKEGWQYINVPIKKHSRNDVINEVIINNQIEWKKKILNQIEHYKKHAPFYGEVKQLLEKIFSHDFERLSELNISIDQAIAEYLGITTLTDVISEMDLRYEKPVKPDEWALNICKALGSVKEYWNAPGGKEFFDAEKYARANIDLKFLKINLHPYKQKGNQFEAGLSIIDGMMFNSVEEINKMLDDFMFI